MKVILWIAVLFTSPMLWAQENYIDLVWSDEFNTDGAPDPSNWGYDLGHGQDGWGNHEMQSYTNNAQNVRVENGMLIIHALKDQNGEWTSARLKSQGKRTFTYGRIVWRAKLPAGSGTWPALWLLCENINTLGWPAGGEIDVMEHVGKWPGQILSAVHTTSSYGDTQNKGFGDNATFNTAFHDYELLWTPEKLAFYVDGVNHYTYAPTVKNAATWPFDSPFFLIMNIAMGGGLGSDPQYETNGLKNGIDPALTQAKMEIDYVRVYQPFDALRLEGPNIVEKNGAGLRYKTNNLQDAVYEWSVPAGAKIISGQGSPEIQVDWGETEGNVKVVVTLDGSTYEKEIAVTHVVKPQGNVYPLKSDNFDIQWADSDDANIFNISEEDNATRIDYEVATPSTVPSLTGMLTRALDLTAHPVIGFRVKSQNASGTVRIRADLVDENGHATDKPPVFNFTPLIDDGAYYDYRFDFNTSNQWQGSGGAVNASRITKINVYVDFGVFGSPGKDSLWIENIWVEQPGQVHRPNRPSHLTGVFEGESIALTWRDNADDESGFRIYTADAASGPWSLFTDVDANTTEALFALGNEDPQRYYFKVVAFDDRGETGSSNVFQLQQTVTSVEERFADQIAVYPNPASQRRIMINLPQPGAVIRVLDVHRSEKIRMQADARTIHLSLDQLPSGVYFISISGRQGNAVRRVVLL